MLKSVITHRKYRTKKSRKHIYTIEIIKKSSVFYAITLFLRNDTWFLRIDTCFLRNDTWGLCDSVIFSH